MSECCGGGCSMRREGWDKRLDRKPEPCERCGKMEQVLYNLFVTKAFLSLPPDRQEHLHGEGGPDDAWMLCANCRKELTKKKK